MELRINRVRFSRAQPVFYILSGCQVIFLDVFFSSDKIIYKMRNTWGVFKTENWNLLDTNNLGFSCKYENRVVKWNKLDNVLICFVWLQTIHYVFGKNSLGSKGDGILHWMLERFYPQTIYSNLCKDNPLRHAKAVSSQTENHETLEIQRFCVFHTAKQILVIPTDQVRGTREGNVFILLPFLSSPCTTHPIPLAR